MSEQHSESDGSSDEFHCEHHFSQLKGKRRCNTDIRIFFILQKLHLTNQQYGVITSIAQYMTAKTTTKTTSNDDINKDDDNNEIKNSQ